MQRHPAALVELEHQIADGFDEANIDQWLTEFCGIKPELLPALEEFSSDPNGRQVAFVFSRSLSLYGALLDYVGVPCLKGGRVLRVAEAKDGQGKYRAAVLFELLDTMPMRLFADLLLAALDLVRSKFSAKPDAETADKLLQQVSANLIEDLKTHSPFAVGGDSILHEAVRQDVPYRHLGLGIVRLGWGAKSRLLRISASDADSQISKEICGMKHRTAQILRAAGLPGAQNHLVRSPEEALAAAEALGWPVVVKPPHRERSEGVMTNIGNEAELFAAFQAASEYDHRVVIERHAPGYCHRIYVAGGQLTYAVRRIPQRVIGDGKSTVSELAEAKNLEDRIFPPWKRWLPCQLDELAEKTLARQGLNFDSVPEEGQGAEFRPFDSHDWGGHVENVIKDIHPDNVQLALQATELVGMSICGVDLMTTDITKPWHETGAIINELNFGPAFRSHDREEEAASVIPALLGGDGRIPVHLVMGEGDLLAAAKALKAKLGKQGGRFHLTTADYSEDAAGKNLHMDGETLFERSLALVLRPDVDGIVMAGSWPDLFKGGFAVDQLESANTVNCDEQTARKLFGALQAQVRVHTFRRLG
ncbi:MAG: acetate--CoA ligase family protein [Sphingomonadaceae bacterium]|nr:acetate--CoA ligase family protein [Sphingomonadaceae bacterium]